MTGNLSLLVQAASPRKENSFWETHFTAHVSSITLKMLIIFTTLGDDAQIFAFVYTFQRKQKPGSEVPSREDQKAIKSRQQLATLLFDPALILSRSCLTIIAPRFDRKYSDSGELVAIR